MLMKIIYCRVEDGRRLSSGSEMDCGSVTPSPRGTPEHSQLAEYLAGNSGFDEILAGNAPGSEVHVENLTNERNDNLLENPLKTMTGQLNSEEMSTLDNRTSSNNLIIDN